jgi:hypothetical protein
LILVPQMYFYSKMRSVKFYPDKTIFISNPLAMNDDDIHRITGNERQSNFNDLSYELGTSGTFLPLTRTPREHVPMKQMDKTITMSKLDQLIYGEQSNSRPQSIYENRSKNSNNHMNISINQLATTDEQDCSSTLVPLQRQVY